MQEHAQGSYVSPMARPYRFLVIEDCKKLARLWKSVLTQEGYDVTTAHSCAEGQDAIAQASRSGSLFDVILLDLILPDGDGTSLLPAITEDLSEAVVIIVSGYLDSETITHHWPTCKMFVPKPFDPDMLLLMVKGALRTREAEKA